MTLLIGFVAFWLACCLYAIAKGGGPERMVGILFLLAFPLSRLAFRTGWQVLGIPAGVLLVDLAMLIPLVLIALRANRQWPIPMAAMQLLQLMGHFLKLAEPSLLPLLYWLSRIAWAYPMLVLLALGTLRHVARERRLGAEPSWSNSSNR